MLQNIRERTQTWIAWVIVILISVIFSLWGVESYFSSNSVDDAVATVNKQPVPRRELTALYNRFISQAQAQFGSHFNLTPEISTELKHAALQQLISTLVLSQAANRMGVVVPDAILQATIMEDPHFQTNGKFNPVILKNLLQQNDFTEQAFLNLMRSSLLIAQIQSGIKDSSFALPNEVDNALSLIHQTRSFSYTIINAAKFNTLPKVTDQAIADYYAANQQQFMQPEQVSIDYVVLNVSDLARKAKQQLAQQKQKIADFYAANKQSFMTPARWQVAQILIRVAPDAAQEVVTKARAKAQAIADQIKQGADFAKMAREHSQDTLSAKNGGVLPWLSAGSQMNADYLALAASLKQPGAVSPVTRTHYGFTLMKLLQHQPETAQSLAAATPRIIDLLAQQKAEEQFTTQKDQLGDLTFSNPNSLQPAADALSLNVAHSQAFGRHGGSNEAIVTPAVVAAAFSDDVLKDGNNSDLIQLNPGQVLVLRLASHQAAKVRTLDAVKAQIVQTLQAAKQRQAAHSEGQRIIAELKAGKLAPAAIVWQTRDAVKRGDKELDADLLHQIFALPRPQQQPTIAGIELANGDYAVIKLSRVGISADAKSAEQSDKQAFETGIERGFGQLEYSAYVAHEMSTATIVKHQRT